MFVIAVHTNLKSALGSLMSEKEKLRQIMEQETCTSPSTQLLGLKSALASVSLLLCLLSHTNTHTHTVAFFVVAFSTLHLLFNTLLPVYCYNTLNALNGLSFLGQLKTA